MFFLKPKSAVNSSKKTPENRTAIGNALRFALMPEFGKSVSPIRESAAVFINILAMIFISQKMFPANHPAYLGINGQKLTLRILISTIWHNLKFTKDNVPQVMMFFVLVLGLFFAAGALLVLVLALFGTVFVKSAHAQGYFSSPAGDDIAQQWIDFLRSGAMTGDFFSLYAEPLTLGGGAIQNAIVGALGFYSHAVLVIAAVILFYHLSAMVVETAHHGVVMGKKADQIWAPIRLVVAIGLLVPIGGGLNSGQYIVFKVVEWGSGLASNVWDLFILNGLEQQSMLGVASVPEYAPDVVYNTFLTQVCKAAYDAANNGGDDSVATNDQNSSNPTNDATNTTGKFTARGVEHQKTVIQNTRYCGGSGFNGSGQNTSATGQAVQANAQSCYNQMEQAVQQDAKKISGYFIPENLGGQAEQQTQPYDGTVQQRVVDWISCLAALPVPNLVLAFEQSRAWGWISAGALLSAISQAESDASDLGALIPDARAPDPSQIGDPVMRGFVQPVITKSAKYVGMLPQGGGGGGGGEIGTDKCAAQRATLMQQAEGMKNQGPAQGHFLDRVFQVIDWLASWNCVWISQPGPLGQGNFDEGIMFIGANPLAEMARLGQACIDTAYDAFDIMVNMQADKGSENALEQKMNATKPKGSAANFGLEGAQGQITLITTLLATITNMFFVAGILLAYYIPLIPFITFLFSTLTWVLAVLEAVVAIPLLAVAHLTVQGEGLPGAMARAGYFFLLNIALRPVLMVFGLIIGLVVFYAAVSYMNLFYEMAISTGGGVASGHLLLSRLVYNAIYVIILYICANSSFKAISHIPDSAMKWMSAAPYHFERMGDAQQVAGTLQSGASQVISGATSAVQQGGWGGAQMLQGRPGVASPIGMISAEQPGAGNSKPSSSPPAPTKPVNH